MIYYVKVKPWSKVEGVKPILQGFVVRVNEPAEDGRANNKALQLLAEHLGVKKAHVRIKSGATSRIKLVEVSE